MELIKRRQVNAKGILEKERYIKKIETNKSIMNAFKEINARIRYGLGELDMTIKKVIDLMIKDITDIQASKKIC